jgi:hypothetical protein
MEKMRLGRTNMIAGKSGFGALPIQRTIKKNLIGYREIYEARTQRKD